jgi:hypothetical protein
MKSFLKLFIGISAFLIFFGGQLHSASAACTPVSNTFPGSFNSFTANDCIPSAWANALEAKLGITSSSVTSSLDFQINNLFTSYGSEIVKATSTTGLLQTLNNLSDLTNLVSARANLGLGSAATHPSTDFLASSTAFVSTVNGSSGAITITSSSLGVPSGSNYLPSSTVFVSTVNGSSGAVTITSSSLGVPSGSNYLPSSTAFVSTVNGSSGAITITSSSLGVPSGSNYLASSTALVTSFNGATGTVTGVSSYNGSTGAVTGGSSNVSTSSPNTWSAPQTVSSSLIVNGTSSISGQETNNGILNTGNVSSTSFTANSPTQISVIQNLNYEFHINWNYSTAGAFGSSTLTDLGSAVQYAYSIAPSSSRLYIPSLPQDTPYTGPIAITTNGKYMDIECTPGQRLLYIGPFSSPAITFDEGEGDPSAAKHNVHLGGSNCLFETSTSTATNSTSTVIQIGVTNGESQLVLNDFGALNGGTGWSTGSNVYMLTLNTPEARGNVQNWNTPTGSNEGESFVWNQPKFTDQGNNSSSNCFYVHSAGATASVVNGGSLDGCGAHIGGSVPNIVFNDVNFEDSNHAQNGTYDKLVIDNSTSTHVTVNNGTINEDATSTNAGGPITEQITNGAQLSLNDVTVIANGSATTTANLVVNQGPGVLNARNVSNYGANGQLAYNALTSAIPSSTQLAISGAANATSGAPIAQFGPDGAVGSSTYVTFDNRVALGYDPATVGGNQGNLDVVGGSSKGVRIMTNCPTALAIGCGNQNIYAAPNGNTAIGNIVPSSSLDVGGNVGFSIATLVASATISGTTSLNRVFLINSAATTTITLNAATTTPNRDDVFQDIGAASSSIAATSTDCFRLIDQTATSAGPIVLFAAANSSTIELIATQSLCNGAGSGAIWDEINKD